jgi:hypothetical protein
MSRRFTALQDFFLGYFHPDWRLDASSRGDVVKEFLKTAEQEVVRATARDLRDLLDLSMSEEQLHDTMLREYSLFYDPWRDGISMREWLGGLLTEMVDGGKV